MNKKQNNETSNNATPVLTREEARAKRKIILAQAAKAQQDGPSLTEVDEADSTLATLILPGG